jgi:hypothetical protein
MMTRLIEQEKVIIIGYFHHFSFFQLYQLKKTEVTKVTNNNNLSLLNKSGRHNITEQN